MSQTKDSWVKELREIVSRLDVAIKSYDFQGSQKQAVADLELFVHSQISLAEKRVERKWREKIAKEMATWFMKNGDYPKAWEEPNYTICGLLSDLIKGE